MHLGRGLAGYKTSQHLINQGESRHRTTWMQKATWATCRAFIIQGTSRLWTPQTRQGSRVTYSLRHIQGWNPELKRASRVWLGSHSPRAHPSRTPKMEWELDRCVYILGMSRPRYTRCSGLLEFFISRVHLGFGLPGHGGSG